MSKLSFDKRVDWDSVVSKSDSTLSWKTRLGTIVEAVFYNFERSWNEKRRVYIESLVFLTDDGDNPAKLERVYVSRRREVLERAKELNLQPGMLVELEVVHVWWDTQNKVSRNVYDIKAVKSVDAPRPVHQVANPVMSAEEAAALLEQMSTSQEVTT